MEKLSVKEVDSFTSLDWWRQTFMFLNVHHKHTLRFLGMELPIK